MRHIQALGVGCPACGQLKKNTETAVAELGIDATVEMISDISKTIGFDVLMTPALAIDGVVKVMGRVTF
jgi:small redox-active disulfide protein 2